MQWIATGVQSAWREGNSGAGKLAIWIRASPAGRRTVPSSVRPVLLPRGPAVLGAGEDPADKHGLLAARRYTRYSASRYLRHALPIPGRFGDAGNSPRDAPGQPYR